ncbi:MAG: hypothetical protein IJ424_03545 [Oscillospiraceae bacterium]|nr:hypothetical protein [Oscillospiraceae bacterium]
MAEFGTNPYGFKEAVTVEAERIFDSCSDRDCLEDLEVVFADTASAELVNEATYVKARCAEITSVFFQVEPIPFNCGFFAVDLTYTFNVTVEVSDGVTGPAQAVTGTATFTKKVILYGSDGGTKYFSSDDNGAVNVTGCNNASLPKASVSVADPIVLGLKLLTFPSHTCCADPSCEQMVTVPQYKRLAITLGLFSIVSLSRRVPVMVPAFDFIVPKDCSCSQSSTTESPCELFEKITFPTNEFFPKSLEDATSSCTSCG